MSSLNFSGLGSDITVALTGVGSFVPPTRVSNQMILDRIRPVRPDGRPIDADWVERHLAITERRLDYDLARQRKLTREEGGLYDGDLSVLAARAAITDAGIGPDEIDLLVHVSTTPDTIACQDHLRHITTQLGLRPDADLVHHNLGCAGLAPGLRTVAAYLTASAPATALLVASNCPSAYFGAEARDAYRDRDYPLSWLVPIMFGDGAGASVWRATPADPEVRRGLCAVRVESAPGDPLVTYPAGGSLHHTTSENVADHVFLMDARRVAEAFAPLIRRDYQMLEDDWPAQVKPLVDVDFDPSRVARWYLHQANGVVVRTAIELLDIPPERAPIAVDRYGNTSAASTLILLDEDRRAGRIREGDLAVFLWIGAGNGAMNGYAAAVL